MDHHDPPLDNYVSSFDEMYRTDYPQVFRSVHLIVGEREHAADVTQEAFARAWARWGRVQTARSPGAWVTTVAIRIALRSKRRDGQRRHREFLARDPAPGSGAVADLGPLGHALTKLSRQQRAAIVLVPAPDRLNAIRTRGDKIRRRRRSRILATAVLPTAVVLIGALLVARPRSEEGVVGQGAGATTSLSPGVVAPTSTPGPTNRATTPPTSAVPSSAVPTTTTPADWPDGLAMDIPDGVAPCNGEELTFASGGLFLLRWFNTGDPCGLAGVPMLKGLDEQGEWHSIPVTPRLEPATNGPPWTGVFSPELVAVISLRTGSASDCRPRETPTTYEKLELATRRGTTLTIEIEFQADDCGFHVTPFSADSQDR